MASAPPEPRKTNLETPGVVAWPSHGGAPPVHGRPRGLGTVASMCGGIGGNAAGTEDRRPERHGAMTVEFEPGPGPATEATEHRP